MYWKIKDSEFPNRRTLISMTRITAITDSKHHSGKIKIHLDCGKEFSADEECMDEPHLIDLEKLLKSRATFNN